MLARLFGKKNDHPMADIKLAKTLLHDLPKSDPLKSVTELGDWIESVTLCEDFKLSDQYAVLSLLDETARPVARKLAYEYFSLPEMNTGQGKLLSQSLGSLSRYTVDAYCTLISRYCNGDGSGIKAQIPLLMARAMRAMREQVKYAAVHYGPYDETLWHRFAWLYSYAEQQQYLDVALNLYSALSAPTTIKREAGQLVVWYACGINTLSPRSMHLAERIIAQYGNSVETTASLNDQVLFGFDLAHPAAPMRINPEATLHPSMRYISLANMQTGLESLIRTLKKNVVPQELNLGGAFAAEWVLDAAQHVQTHLVAPQLRASVRRELSSAIEVVAGFENVYGYCAGHADCTGMQWLLENISAHGFSAVVPFRGAENLRIGTLLGMRGDAQIEVAIVRRMLRDADGRLHVGVEMLASQVVEVMLDMGAACGKPALWLHSDREDGTARLLMQADVFSLQFSPKVCLAGRTYLLIPVKLLEKSVDYDFACYRVIEWQETEVQQ